MGQPSSLVDFASDTNFSSGVDSGTPTKVNAGSGANKQGFVPGAYFLAQYVNYVLNNFYLWLNYLKHLDTDSYFLGQTYSWTAIHTFTAGATVSGADLDVSNGNIYVTTGNLGIDTGSIYVTAGDVQIDNNKDFKYASARTVTKMLPMSLFLVDTTASAGSVDFAGTDQVLSLTLSDSYAGTGFTLPVGADIVSVDVMVAHGTTATGHNAKAALYQLTHDTDATGGYADNSSSLLKTVTAGSTGTSNQVISIASAWTNAPATQSSSNSFFLRLQAAGNATSAYTVFKWVRITYTTRLVTPA